MCSSDLSGEKVGEERIEPLITGYATFSKWQERLACVYHLLGYAKNHQEVFELGIRALSDKAAMVRYRACQLLAYSQKAEALPALQDLLNHRDAKSVEDAKAAIDAITHRNHHYFVDRNHTGQMFMAVGPPSAALEMVVQKSKDQPWWKFWGRKA